MGKQAFTSMKNAALWVQPGGPGNPVHFLGCHDLDDIEESEGGTELIRCFRRDGQGWDVVGVTQSPPDPVTTSVETLLFPQRDWLDKLKCPFAIYALQRDCGRADVFANHVRGQIIQNARRVSRKYSGMSNREEDTTMTAAYEIEGTPPLLDVDTLQVDRIATTFDQAWNDVWANSDSLCPGDCGSELEEGDHVAVASDSAAGPATADVPLSSNNGLSWAAAATDPFAAAKSIMAVTEFFVGRTTRRILAVEEAQGAAQGHVAYSDDGGATWTVVNLGGAAAGHGSVYGGTLFALDQFHVWLASAEGYIYFSADGGATWSAQEAGTITAGDYRHIHFANEFDGMAVAEAGVVAVTSDGGTTWTAVTTIAAVPDLNTCWMTDRNILWVGTATGLLFRSSDGGTTWTGMTNWIGTGVGQVRDIAFANEHQGLLVSNTAAPVGSVHYTIDGGYSWNRLTTPTNSGLNACAMVSPTKAFVVGEVDAATAMVLRLSIA